MSGMNCANCGKGVMYGHDVSHAKNRTKRLFKPNLHTARLVVNGVLKRANFCTKCLRKLKKEMLKKDIKSKTETPLTATL